MLLSDLAYPNRPRPKFGPLYTGMGCRLGFASSPDRFSAACIMSTAWTKTRRDTYRVFADHKPRCRRKAKQVSQTEAFARMKLPSIPRRLIDLEIMHLAFLAAGRDRHAYASAGVGAACGPVPAFLIGIDQIAIFPMHHALA